METIVNDIGKENPQLFKSYYVVWKLFLSIDTEKEYEV